MRTAAARTTLLVAALLLAACGGDDTSPSARSGGSTTLSSPDGPVIVGSGPTVSKATVAGWPAKFCSLKVGTTRSRVRAVMGTPTREIRVSSASNQDSWQGGDVRLVVFYSANDTARLLSDVSVKRRAPCAQNRSRG